MNDVKERLRWQFYRIWGDTLRFSDAVFSRLHARVPERKRTLRRKALMEIDAFASYLQKRLQDPAPFMLARYGSLEAGMVFEFLGKEHFHSRQPDRKLEERFFFNTGFFPKNPDLLKNFQEVMLDASAEADALGFWNGGHQEYLIDQYCRNDVVLTALRNIEPWTMLPQGKRPWTAALKGKRVMVVHPFVQSIRAQYERRERLWENPEILPEFTLLTFPAVQTIAGQKDTRFADWFEALEYMRTEILRKDFDIAVLGCGSYGMPLAAALKKEGKKAIHMGGSLQLWFGIKGRRWDKNPYIRSFYNDAWIRPAVEETPPNMQYVENGCYW